MDDSAEAWEFTPEEARLRAASVQEIRRQGYASAAENALAHDRADAVSFLDELTQQHPHLSHDEARESFLSGIGELRIERATPGETEHLLAEIDRYRSIVDAWSSTLNEDRRPDDYLALGRLQKVHAEIQSQFGSEEIARLALAHYDQRFADRSYQAGRQFAADSPSVSEQIDFSKPPQIYRREDFERGVQDYQKERQMAEERSLGRDEITGAGAPDRVQIVSPQWLESEAKTIQQAAEMTVPAAEIALANAYWNGRRESFNSAREDVLLHNPRLGKDLPPAIQMDEIRVRQKVLEQEETGRSLAISR